MIRSILPLNWALLAIAAVLAGLLATLERDALQTRPVEPLFPDFDGARATSLVIAAPESEEPGEGNAQRASLSRADAGANWTVDELEGAPASERFVDGLMARIGAMTTLDLLSEDPGRLAEYELDEASAVRVTVRAHGASEDDGGLTEDELLADVYVSAATETAAFVRRAGDARVYRIASLRVPPADPFRWFDRRSLVPFENVQIARVTGRGDAVGAEVVLVQPQDRFGSYRDAAGESVPTERAAQLLESLRALFPIGVDRRLDATEFPEEQVSFEVEVQLRTGNVFRVQFGDLEANAEAGVATTRSDDTLVVLCDRRAVDNVLARLRVLAE